MRRASKRRRRLICLDPLAARLESRAIAEDIRLAVDGEDHAAFGAVRFVHRVGLTPDVFTRARDAVVVGERAGEYIALLDLRVLVKRQRRARLPAQQARHLAARLVFVQHLDLDALELRGLPFHRGGVYIHRAVGGGFEVAVEALGLVCR